MAEETVARVAKLESRVVQLMVSTAILAIAWISTMSVIVVWNRTSPVLAVQRLEIREPDGTLAFALASSAHPIIGTMDGQVIMSDQDEERRHPSFIFFDGRGDEVGGMIFRTQDGPSGRSVARFLTFDGIGQDETVVLGHTQDPGGTVSGLRVQWIPRDVPMVDALEALGLRPGFTRAELQAAVEAIPAEEREARLRSLAGSTRVLLGSNREESATLSLHDMEGRPRLVLEVTSEGEPSIHLLSDDGRTVLRLP